MMQISENGEKLIDKNKEPEMKYRRRVIVNTQEVEGKTRCDKLTTTMIDEFVDKITRLHAARFSDKALLFSKHGFEQTMETYLSQHGIVFSYGTVK